MEEQREALAAIAQGIEEQILFLKRHGFEGPLELRCGGKWDDPYSYHGADDYETFVRWEYPDRMTLISAVVDVALAGAPRKRGEGRG